MLVELFNFQQKAMQQLRQQCAAAHNEYNTARLNQVIAFTAPTGSGKTIIMAALIEEILFGSESFVEQPDAIFVWLSDSPELNRQSRDKIDTKANKVRPNQCVTISDDSFDREMLEEGHIYFLNTQKLTRSSNLTHHSDSRQYTIWETLSNTIHEKADRLYFIIDEAHRGMRGREAGKATSIMQKFILGSPDDGLPPVPVVIGMSATIQRFTQLLSNSSATSRRVQILPDEVRASGLLKDRIVITYPTDTSEQKDIAVLQAATDEWLSKCQHWEAYCKEQHDVMVKPVFVVQVLNGSEDQITATDLKECLQKIEERAGIKFERGEVIHSFGDKRGVLNLNGLDVPYEEPSRISDNKQVRVVFFKETLSTGWDCPRAETMMSFRHYSDATAIAQLLGRMVRTPRQKHILVDDMLNEVRLFLPHFDHNTVSQIVDELQNSEGGELPTDVIEDDFNNPLVRNYTSRNKGRQSVSSTVNYNQVVINFTDDNNPIVTTPAEVNLQTTKRQEQTSSQQQSAVSQQVQPTTSIPTSVRVIEFDFNDGIDREGIIKFINEQALPTYNVRTFRQNSYVKSLFKLCSFLQNSGIDTTARKKTVDDIVEKIHKYILDLKSAHKYAEAKEKVMNFEMLSDVYDAFGTRIKDESVRKLFSEADVDLDRQVRFAEKQLGDEGISVAYGQKYDDVNNQIQYMVDVILYANDETCLSELEQFCKDRFYNFNDKYRRATTKLNDTMQTRYRDIVRDSAEVSNVPFSLGENISFRTADDGEEYTDHLFVDERTGKAKIKLNRWEKLVIAEEQKNDEFRCWYRNPTKGSNALAIAYDYKHGKRNFYPDFIIVRREAGSTEYIIDLLEPHAPTMDDNVGKAKALSAYAANNSNIGRAQLIRVENSAVGERLLRLDFATSSELRDKVARITLPEELDELFRQYAKYNI